MAFKVPFVNVPKQYENIKEEVLKTVDDVFSRGDLILRKDVEEFERNLASFVGTKYVLGLNSGTDALFLSLLAADVGPGDEVITVSHTFVASIAVIVNAGAKPVLADVKEDFTIDMEKLEELITPRTKAIIPVHLNGRMCDMEKLMEIAKKHNLFIIEDAAQSLGAKFKGKMAGSFGLAGGFSMYPFKVLGAFGDAGAMATNDENIFEKVKLLRDHGQKTKTEIVCFGWNSRLDNLQAAFLNVKFKHLPEWIERRREIAKIYNIGLADIKDIKLPPAPGSDTSSAKRDEGKKRTQFSSPERYFDVFQNYVLRAQKRDELFNFLKERGVETLIKDPVANHKQPGLGLSHFNLPVSEQLAKEVLSLPIYPELRDEQIKYVINYVKEFYQR